MLIDSMDYVWQVRARDKSGRDLFRNNGYSEVCFFTYGGADPNFTVREIDNLQVELLTDRIARLHWGDGSAEVTGEFETYRLQFRKDDPQFDWHQHDTDSTEQRLYDLVPQATYEARIQGGKKDASGRLYWGDYSPIMKFTMPEERVLVCGEGDPYLQRNNPGKPKYDVIKATEVDAYGIPMVMDSVINLGEGYYQGTGYVRVAMLANARMPVKFDRIFINDSLQVTAGRIVMLTRGVQALRDSLKKDTTTIKDPPIDEPANPGDRIPELPEIIIPIAGTIEEIYLNDEQQIIVVDAEGNEKVLELEKDHETGD